MAGELSADRTAIDPPIAEWRVIITAGDRSPSGLARGLLRLACPIQFHQHAPCVKSSRKKALQILMWVRQRLLEKRTQGESKRGESRIGVAQGRSPGNVGTNRGLKLVRIAGMVETGTHGV